MTARSFWESDHLRRRHDPALREPTAFARAALLLATPGSTLLDLGCGNGHDSVFFAEHGLQVTSMDIAASALDHFLPTRTSSPVTTLRHSLDDIPYPWPPGSFDLVYARLSLHYFDTVTTTRIFDEIHRLLRPGGTLLSLVNSVMDPECAASDAALDVFLETAPGLRKRYFSPNGLLALAQQRFPMPEVSQCGTFLRLTAERTR